MRIASRLVLLLTTAIALAAAPVAAQGPGPDPVTTPRSAGRTLVLHDGPGDVWTFSDSTSGYEPAVQPAADVLRARVTHGAYAVSVRLVFDDLQRVSTQWYYCEIHTPGVTSWFILEALKGRWHGTLWQDVEGEWVRAPGTSHHIDYASDVVTMRFPRTLLGGAPWVRVRLHNSLGIGGGTFFTDNPMTHEAAAAYTVRLLAP